MIVVAFVQFLVGGLTFAAAFQAGRDRTLLWVATSIWLACLGFLMGIARERIDWFALSVIVTNSLIITGHACLWTSLNVFRGRPVSWAGMGLGAAAWLLLSLWPAFMLHAGWRVVAYSLICLCYIGASVRAVWPQWRLNRGAALPLLCFLVAHGGFYVYRVFTTALPGDIWPYWPDFSLVMLEALFFGIGLPFGVLMMVRARAEQNYRYAALHDALTKLPNRRALFERGAPMLENARLNHVDVAVLMCDLDWFKAINDRFGHEAGDHVLARFAQVLRGCAGDSALPARLGGEEFTVLATSLGPLGAQALAARIRAQLSDQAASLPCAITVSIGIACAQQVGYNLDRLLARADQALYAAKTSGRDCVRAWPVWVSQDARDASAAISRGGGGAACQHPVDA
ncbi:diguanylate cyclase domain-containing protein [Castellaniella hirudinis]|uniref:GGDEF domain-containing protein n=1 Tax=Castellaniella hirudinis TaxID=1144617 RepID=UPI0039C485BF